MPAAMASSPALRPRSGTTPMISRHSGYILNKLAIFSPMPALSKRAVRWVPGRYHMQPFASVAPSRAIQREMASREEKDQ